MKLRRGPTRAAVSAAISLAMLLGAFAVPAGVSADDGQQIGYGSNIAGEVYMSGERPRFNFTNVGDCPGNPPPAGSSCELQIRFRWLCEEPWCLTYSYSSWYSVPAGQDFYQAAICADGKNYWEVETRERYSSANIATVEFWGQYEYLGYLGTSGLIAKSIFNVSSAIGTRISGGVKMNTITASTAYSTSGVIATSFGNIQGPASC